ncbi:hypothetical protein GCM10023340_01160 [Nocardioides marinquilinus]|uniref:DUF222 domain-containing protein n=1 Tax=Nocardioides marinquilinus TaxID=1210400 RepID=A0ABP9P4X3_9ACTN
MTTIAMYLEALRSGEAVWRDQSAELGTVATSLADVDAALLGARVAPGVQAFLDGWGAQLASLGRRAEGHADAVHDAAARLGLVDDETAARLAALLPHDAPRGLLDRAA